MDAVESKQNARICPECGASNRVGPPRCHRCGFELSASSRERQLIGRMIGPFRLEAIRRRTATGTAFAAVDQADGRWVELKVLPLRGSSPAERERRRRELELRIAHPNLVRVLSAGEAGDFAYIATDARPDEQPLLELGKQTPLRALEIACELARALECIHEHALVHRCLGPEQTLIDPGSDSVRLADLGLAHPAARAEENSLTVLGERLADPAYAAPETAEDRFSPASDLYSLGATLAFCLTGRAPFAPEFQGRQPLELKEAGAVPGVAALLRLLTQPEPTDRPRSARSVRARLQTLLGEPADEAAPVVVEAGPLRKTRFPELREEAETVTFVPADFQNLPLPLAQAAQAAWNARPGLPRRMIAYLVWEGLTRLLAAIGVALLREAGLPLPAVLRRSSFRPSFGIWIGLARDCLQACPREDPLANDARSLLFASDGGRRSTLLRFLERLLELRNKSAHIWPQDEEIDLLSRMVELSRSSGLFAAGKLVSIEGAALASSERVRYQPLELGGAQGPYRGRTFTAAAGLAPGRIYWRCGRRFLELDPFWIIDDGEVLLLQRVDPQRPRYGALDGSPPRVIKHRYPEIQVMTDRSASRRLPQLSADEGAGSGARAPEPEEALDPLVGRVLGNVYRIVEPIGRGAMGTVYRGWDTRLQREVALKLLVGGSWAAAEVRQRFLSEARVLASLGHPHIVRIFEVGEEAGSLYFVMELLPGPTLEGWLATQCQEGPPDDASLRQRVAWIVDAARALHAVHQLDVVHRDVKPANLMLDEQGRVRVLDFGLAHVAGEDLTRSRAQLGTPRYMAPEQIIDAKRVGPVADVYGLGMTLYALLSGKKPFHDLDTDHDILKQAQLGNLPRLSRRMDGVPVDLDTIVARATQPDEGKRYPSAAELADDLERWLQHRPIRARAASVAERVTKYCRRHPVRAVALTMLMLLVAGMGGTTFWALSQKSEKERALAESERHAANVERLYDLVRIEDLLERATVPSDTSEALGWLARHRDLSERVLVYEAERQRVAEQLQRADSLSFRQTDAGREAQRHARVLGELFARWRDVEQARTSIVQALAALRLQAAAAAAHRATLVTRSGTGMELILVPAARFTRGSPSDDPESWGGEWPAHPVTLTRSFYLGRFEVSQREFEQVMHFNPSVYRDPDVPVQHVRWFDAIAFCNALSARDGFLPAYSLDQVEWDSTGSIAAAKVQFHGLDAPGYRLPTEAEWEWACRATTLGPRYAPLERIAWWKADGKSRPQVRGGKEANFWGFHDQLGNVAEWCWDVDGPYPEGAVDPLGPPGEGPRIWRGGHFLESAGFCRAPHRLSGPPTSRRDTLGFRVARSIVGP